MNESLAERFRRLREVRGWTQRLAGDAFGVDQATYGRWERGDMSPSRLASRMLELYESGMEQGDKGNGARV